jgi:cation-transporting ATPase I
MSAALAEEPRLLHALPGRLRVHVPGLTKPEQGKLEIRLRQLRGVQSIQANAVTGNALILFDLAVTDQETVLAALRGVEQTSSAGPEKKIAPAPPAAVSAPVITERKRQTRRARIAVRGLDRSPRLARHVVERLQRRPGVRAIANPLTGRVLVEFTEHEVELEDLIAEVSEMELPDLPDEDQPTHPLDPGPLIQSTSRLTGATLGLGLLAVRRLLQSPEPLVAGPVVANTVALLGIARGFPFVRNGLRRLLGHNAADLALSTPLILGLTLSGSPLGLALSAAEALRILTEVMARRSAWKSYEQRLGGHIAAAQPGGVIRLDSGERAPFAGTIIEGTGTAIGHDGLPVPLAPGAQVGAGAPVHGGPFVVELETAEPFTPEPRPAPVAPSLYDRYIQVIGPCSLAFAAGTALLTRSFPRTLAALLLVTPRVAIIGQEAAGIAASARVLRAGVTVVGTRPGRTIRRPDLVILDTPRLLTDRFELSSVAPLIETDEAGEIVALAAAIASVSGAPWGQVFPAAHLAASDGAFDGKVAAASLGGVRYSLGPLEDWASLPAATRWQHRGEALFVLRNEREGQALGLFALRPRLAQGVSELVQTCRRLGVEVALLSRGNPTTSQAMARRAAIPLLESENSLEAIRARQAQGALVAFVSDSAHAAEAFAACDLAIGLAGVRNHLPARADLLAPDLSAVAAIIEAGAQRDLVVRDSVAFSAVANGIGAALGVRAAPAVEDASIALYIAALVSLGDGWLRLQGGERSRSTLLSFVDPHPERWGRRSVANVLQALQASEEGLTSAQAAERQRGAGPQIKHHPILRAMLEQLHSPLNVILGGAAAFSLARGVIADVGIIGATIVANIAVSAWQEHRAGQVTESLERLGSATARVLRDGQGVTISAKAVVPGDVLLLASGDRVAADARLLSAQNLEVDEAALTGESLPVLKSPDGGSAESRVVLEGSNVTSGSGQAVVVAVGHQTRMGATAAALAVEETRESPLGARLSRLFRQILPLAAAGGAIVSAVGFLRSRQLLPQLTMGATIAVAAMPEGLPLLASVSEAGVAHRLSERQALVRRISAVEALGRVDVACVDKTGTLTQGRLALRSVSSFDDETTLPATLSASLRHVLLVAALASPHPDAADATAHPTDVAVIQGALESGLGQEMRVAREAESPFDPTRSYHATLAQGSLSLKGAPEILAPRCDWILRNGGKQPLDEAGQQVLLARARSLAERGLRVLMVAEGLPDASIDHPQGLVALGFIGISDPLRLSVQAAVRRCHAAGIRVMMITGDHPATARAIAQEAGLLGTDGIISAPELAELHNGELDQRLADATVIARATPLDKLRIVESLQRQGHTVAMTGDGVNDAPALRLADVGVAMGHGGTEVARQTADIVLADDDFSTLVESLVEGRSYWRNIRRALGILLGGNLGELGLLVGASVFGFASPLTTRQILAVNLVTDVLPGLAIALQQPEHRDLAGLAREGTAALDTTLRRDVLRRGLATTLPSLAAYLIALGSGTLPAARTVAFSSIVTTQLAQSLDVGLAEGSLTRSVVGAIGGSAGLLAASLVIPPLRAFLNLALPTPFGWVLIGGGTLAAVSLGRMLDRPAIPGLIQALPPAPPAVKQLGD